MIIGNVKIFTEQGEFIPGMVRVSEGRIKNIYLQQEALWEENREKCSEAVKEEYLDGKGHYLIPGMIDIHLHGCRGYDFCDGTLEAIVEIAKYQASIGVTAMVPTTMTLPVKRLEKILELCAVYRKKMREGEYEDCAELAGINMEGPFISEERRGAQNAEYIRKPEAELFYKFQEAAKGLIRYIGIAPELEGAMKFIEEIKEHVKVTLAHSNADYDTAMKALYAGASHVTHLYNGMAPYTHRLPGIVGAVYDSKSVEAELICDGIHIHPMVIRATFGMLGKERIILISDSIRATGMEPGDYNLGDLRVTVKENRAVLSGTETIAGSVMNLPQTLQFTVKKVGIPLADAVLCVTRNPAKSLGIYEECGSITVGKRADMVFLDENLDVTGVVKNGRLLWNEKGGNPVRNGVL